MEENKMLSEIKFDDQLLHSAYIRPLRMHYIRSGLKLYWDLALEFDNVAVLLFHTEKKCFILVKQFRPACFVARIRQMEENVGKSLNSIEWSKYPITIGETLELCAGLMDKPDKGPLQTVKEEILEECGFNIDAEKIRFIKKYLTGVGISGSSQHLFYAEVDDSMKANEGGGNTTEGEFIEKVFLDLNGAKELLNKTSVDSPPSLLNALEWFLSKNPTKL